MFIGSDIGRVSAYPEHHQLMGLFHGQPKKYLYSSNVGSDLLNHANVFRPSLNRFERANKKHKQTHFHRYFIEVLSIEHRKLLSKLIYNINQKNKMIKSITVEIIEILELIDHHLAIPLLILSETRHTSLYLVSPIPVMLFLYNLLPLLHFQGLEKCLDEDHFKVQERF